MQQGASTKPQQAGQCGVPTSRSVILAILGAAVMLGIAFAILLARSIVRPLRNAMSVAEAIGEGKLDNPIEPAARTRPASC